MKIIGFSIGVNYTNYQFGTHRCWSVFEFETEDGAKEKAQCYLEHVRAMYPTDEPRIITLYGE